MELFIYNENRTDGLHFIYIELNQDDGRAANDIFSIQFWIYILAYEYLITIIPVYLCSATFVLISVNIYVRTALFKGRTEQTKWIEWQLLKI